MSGQEGRASGVGGGEPRVSGALACGLRGVVAEMVGAEVVERVLARISDDVRRDYEDTLPVGWVEIRVMETVFGEIAADLGTTVGELHARVARTSIERTFRTLWRMLLRITTDTMLVSRTPVIFARSYDRGRLEATIPSPGRGDIALLDWPDVPEWPLRGTRIGIETVLTLAGRRDVKVSCSRTPTGAVFHATWR